MCSKSESVHCDITGQAERTENDTQERDKSTVFVERRRGKGGKAGTGGVGLSALEVLDW